MSEEKIIELHPSKAGLWLSCSRRAEYETANPNQGDPGDIHVGQMVGQMVGSAITGQRSPEPFNVEYDEITPGPKQAKPQVEEMIQVAREVLSEKGWEVEEQEVKMEKAAKFRGGIVMVRGAADLVVRDKEGKRWIIDLKTGKRKPVSVFLQVALYAWMWKQTREEDLEGGGLIWLRRQKKRLEKATKVETLALKPLEEMAQQVIKQMAHHAVCGTVPSPGLMTCQNCGLRPKCPAGKLWYND